jgi:hypothetical protein
MYVTRDVIKKPFIKKGFNINAIQQYLAEREGFEPSKGFLNPYSLSRGAPSATRPPLIISFFTTGIYGVKTGMRKHTVSLIPGKDEI